MEPVLRSAQVLKEEAEDIGFEGKDILEYVKHPDSGVTSRGKEESRRVAS